MTQILRQSTAVDVLIGPFVDITDGATAETGESPSVKLSKNGQALGAKNDATTPASDADGYYNCELDATDTNTVGTLILTVAASVNALPVRHEFQVVEEATYDFLYASGATSRNLATLTDAFILTSAIIETVTSQTQLVLPATADAVEDGAYHGAIAVLIDADDANNKSLVVIEDYTASTRTVILARAPTFTVTTADTITILATTGANGVWDMILTGAKHNIATSAGKRLRQIEEAFVHADGTIATVTNGHTFTLDSGAVATANHYIGDRLQIIEGTGEGQSRIIVGYTSGRVVTLDSDFVVNPDTSSLYEINAADVHVAVSDADLAEGFVAVYTNTTTITLDAGAVATTDYYKDRRIIFTHGAGAGQSREIKAYTSGRVVTLSPALITALDTTTTYHIVDAVDVADLVGDLLTTQMTESYAANGVAPTLAQCQFAIHQMLMQFGISGTSLTVRKLDDSTTAFVVTLDSATNPTDAKRV